MSRQKIVAGNWKMNGLWAEAEDLARKIATLLAGPLNTQAIVFPPFTSLMRVRDALVGSPVKLGAQDLFYEMKGAFTGEISPAMLLDAGCSHVLIGHSERRHIIKEPLEFIQKKLRAALSASLTPVLCVGETWEQRKSGQMDKVLAEQLQTALADVDLAQVVVAYEPVWAIGTGQTASPQQAQDAHAWIRNFLGLTFGEKWALDIPLLYGGSVTPENVVSLVEQPDVDGALIGGASLKALGFADMVHSVEGL